MKHMRPNKPDGRTAKKARNTDLVCNSAPGADDWLHNVVRCANDVGEEIRSAPAGEAINIVKSVISNNDLVFGVWADPTMAHGVGTLVIKGGNELRDIISSGRSQPLKVSAVPCMCAEQAEAARIVLGDSSPE